MRSWAVVAAAAALLWAAHAAFPPPSFESDIAYLSNTNEPLPFGGFAVQSATFPLPAGYDPMMVDVVVRAPAVSAAGAASGLVFRPGCRPEIARWGDSSHYSGVSCYFDDTVIRVYTRLSSARSLLLFSHMVVPDSREASESARVAYLEVKALAWRAEDLPAPDVVSPSLPVAASSSCSSTSTGITEWTHNLLQEPVLIEGIVATGSGPHSYAIGTGEGTTDSRFSRRSGVVLGCSDTACRAFSPTRSSNGRVLLVPDNTISASSGSLTVRLWTADSLPAPSFDSGWQFGPAGSSPFDVPHCNAGTHACRLPLRVEVHVRSLQPANAGLVFTSPSIPNFVSNPTTVSVGASAAYGYTSEVVRIWVSQTRSWLNLAGGWGCNSAFEERSAIANVQYRVRVWHTNCRLLDDHCAACLAPLESDGNGALGSRCTACDAGYEVNPTAATQCRAVGTPPTPTPSPSPSATPTPRPAFMPAADFESDVVLMSNDARPVVDSEVGAAVAARDHYFAHGLGEVPASVDVLVMVQSTAYPRMHFRAGCVPELARHDDPKYNAGISCSFDGDGVQLWSRASSTALLYLTMQLTDGAGANPGNVVESTVQVKVLAWRRSSLLPPSWESGQTYIARSTFCIASTGSFDVRMAAPTGTVAAPKHLREPVFAEAVVQSNTSPSFYTHAVGLAQSTNTAGSMWSGVVFGCSESGCRAWAPTSSSSGYVAARPDGLAAWGGYTTVRVWDATALPDPVADSGWRLKSSGVTPMEFTFCDRTPPRAACRPGWRCKCGRCLRRAPQAWCSPRQACPSSRCRAKRHPAWRKPVSCTTPPGW